MLKPLGGGVVNTNIHNVRNESFDLWSIRLLFQFDPKPSDLAMSKLKKW